MVLLEAQVKTSTEMLAKHTKDTSRIVQLESEIASLQDNVKRLSNQPVPTGTMDRWIKRVETSNASLITLLEMTSNKLKQNVDWISIQSKPRNMDNIDAVLEVNKRLTTSLHTMMTDAYADGVGSDDNCAVQ